MTSSAVARTIRTGTTMAAVVAVIVGSTPCVSVHASTRTCGVKNVTTGTVYQGRGSKLQIAIREANTLGTTDTLNVTGACIGQFHIGKPLTLRGVSTPAFPVATLDGNSNGTVLTVAETPVDTEVTIRNLTITRGYTTAAGAGILNHAHLILEGSTTVTGNEAVAGAHRGNGGGIANYGNQQAYPDLELHDSTVVEKNFAQGKGGGIANRRGEVRLSDSAVVRNNVAHRKGGGISNVDASVGMGDASRVTSNRSGTVGSPGFGGGIYNKSGVYLGGSAAVTANSAVGGSGGGIYNDDGGWVEIFCSRSVVLSPTSPDDPPETDNHCD
jgi:hypothetical protein